MQLIPVNDEKGAEAFLTIAADLYKNCKNWIRPLDKDINEVFDPEKNKFFRHGECGRWLLCDDKGKYIGRIAAFIHKKYRNKGDTQLTGGIGFFECINDQKAANFMFDHCKRWLQQRGMEAMDGPINFGERNKWWGLLVDGFHEPLYCMNYNPPYYRQLFENYGFRIFFNQICFALKVNINLQKKFYERHARIAENPDYSAQHFDKKRLEKFATDFSVVYNKAWKAHDGGKSLEPRQAVKIFEQMKPVIDENLIWFIYYQNEPIGCWLNLPDLNQYFKFMNGKLNLWNKLKFLWYKRKGTCRRFIGLVFGIIPEFQGTGADTYMIVECGIAIQKQQKYEDFEMQWIGDFNPKMINIAESLGTYRSRHLITYRYLFDRTKPFKRHPILN